MSLRFLPSKLTPRALWAAVAAALALVLAAVAIVVGAGQQPGPGSPAADALADVAAAQAEAKKDAGRYGSFWLTGGDRSLESLAHPLRTDGVSDLRAIECADGWVAAARAGQDVLVRSSSQDQAVRAGSADIPRPDCVTAAAVEAMLSDLGAGPEVPAPAESAFARPDGASAYRPGYHITPRENWMNDPQRPFWLDGLWHYYYLYNAGYPEENGTEWYHLTSTDLVHWKDEGVAIEKYKNGLGDIETGSAVVDYENSAGFGKGAVIAVMTQQDDGIQRQSLFYSTDKGYTFKPYDGNPVMDNPGEQHWRDPKIIRDDANNQWVMALAEGEKIGLYASANLKEWRYLSAFERKGLGILECPEFFQLDVDGDPAKRTWVLAASANGAEEGKSTGVAYWTGTWDGTRFEPSDQKHQWLDDGSDFYAAVTWDDPRLTESQRMGSRHAIAWLNNWAYARKLPTDDWHGGADTLVRDIRLKTVSGKPTLVSSPTGALKSLEGDTATVEDRKLTPDGAAGLPAPDRGAYRLDLTLERAAGDDGSEAKVELLAENGVFATVGYDFESGTAFVTRDGAAKETAGLAPDYGVLRRAESAPREGRVRLEIFVDHSSVEVFVNDGERTLTSLVFPAGAPKGLKALTKDGTLTLKSFSYTPMAATS
ncbi:levanbiose-producing levanase [Arthrobacter sp. PvP023]|uniref:glycoside hydrolase family 32 protein n=1 Tax=Micrococcaceae TaxID=1268 RepID=UPI001AE67E7B|nr:glycoside hydrolase family 32 protein [Arthrobacter sp. PvP023]MBP1134427.1 levanbiose-producing levanase [Arthrobacter sp. PvP023]